MNRKQGVLLFVVAVILLAYLLGGGEKILHPDTYQALFQRSPINTALIFFLAYTLGTALSLPVMFTLSVFAGAIFGHTLGLALALLACTTGGTLACLFSRYLFQEPVQKHFATQLAATNAGLEKQGLFYLFSVRMVPVIPFWLVNLLMGLTAVTALRFFVATLSGMLPITLILVNFGTQLGAIESFSIGDIFSPGLLVSLALLAALPFLSRAILRAVAGQFGRLNQ